VTYLGPDLPASDIALAVEQANAEVVALSITVEGEPQKIKDELHSLRQALPGGVVILVGGQASDNYKDELNAIGARYMKDLSTVRGVLRELGEQTNGSR
jgi:methylmalonyl-CoA mutase cobalamin-binding subunit